MRTTLRSYVSRRVLAGAGLVVVTFMATLFLLRSCKDERQLPNSPGAESRGLAQASAPSPGTAQHDPNAENPDRDRWVDLATVPFRKEWVGGRLVQLRPS